MLEQRIAECQRLNREPMTVLSMDLDDFKRVNNSFGHGIGDRLLAGAAEVIKKQLRQMDVLSRYAGDEFVAVMPMASKEVALMVAERIRNAVEAHKFPVRTGRTTQVGISIGIACFPHDGETSEDLFMSAERNMQHDKHARRLAPNLATTGSPASLDAFS
jgi:diguanylate cyclase (GGDEF)-like protein